MACFVHIDEKGGEDNRGFQYFGHYMQPAIIAMFIGWDSVQIHHQYIKFNDFQVRIVLYSLIVWMSHLFLIAYWYNRDQSQLSSAQKAYEAGQFFTFLSALLIFIILGIMQIGNRLMKIIFCGFLILGGIILLISGCYQHICLGCDTIWCNGHALGYYMFVFVLTFVVGIDCIIDHKEPSQYNEL